jgi:hypothetical protein
LQFDASRGKHDGSCAREDIRRGTHRTAGGTPALPFFKWWSRWPGASTKNLDLVWVWFYKDVAPTALEMKYCESCGKAVADDNIVCPDPQCHGHLRTTPKEKITVSHQEISTITDHVWKKIWKKHLLLIFGEFSVLALIGFFGLLDIYEKASNKVQTTIVTTITNEFQTDRIHATVSDVASNEARGLLIAQVMPEVTNFEGQVGLRLQQINDTANNVVSGLYSNMVFDTFSGSDSNHVVKYASEGATIHVIIRLNYVPIPGSILGIVRGGGGLDIPQNLVGPIPVNRNVFAWSLTGYDLATTSFSIQYVKDARETNIVRQVTTSSGNVFVDGIPVRFQ